MSDSRWMQLMPTPSDEAGIELLRQLWLDACRVEAALSSRRLADIARRFSIERPAQSVHVVTEKATATPGSISDAVPSHWWIMEVSQTPAPEFALFYERGSSFPAVAVVFNGEAGPCGWLTYHRRPLILQRLRERIEQISSLYRPRQEVCAVRERSVAADGNRTAPARPDSQPEYVQPRQLYRAILAAHFSTSAPDGTMEFRPDHAPPLAAHQERAYERACGILDRFGGVIIADAVGLGKTYVALRLLESALQSGGEGLIVVPAALREQWERELSYLRPYSAELIDVPSDSASGENLDLWVRENGGGRIEILTIESLSQRSFVSAKFAGADIVIVDEAHNFRNPQTQRYRNLAGLVRHSRVVLLTATPINNTLLDLQHLIELFAAPGAFRHLGINDFRAVFRRAAGGEGDVRGIISACVLRRTRRFLRTCYGEVVVHRRAPGKSLTIRFPEHRSTVAIQYDLARTYSDLFTQLEDWFSSLYFPSITADPQAQLSDSTPGTVASLLKIIMLKRLESSVEAFRRTVSQQLAWCRTALQALAAGRVLSRPEYRAAFRGPADDPGCQLTFFELVLPLPAVDARRISDFRRQVEHDTEILSRIHADLGSIGMDEDHKAAKLIELLDDGLARRKVLIFTEFLDTARYLHYTLRNRPHIAQIDSEAARLGRERVSRRDVIERFAPRSNGVREPPETERVDILIATDVLSEGLNLQDAAAVVSYDLPWNPVRLMQRIGRIDRLGAVHDSVELHHFVPSRELEHLLGLMDRLRVKVRTIETTLGADIPVLGQPGQATRDLQHLRILASSPEGYDQVEADLEGPFDPDEQAYLDCIALRKEKDVAVGQPLVSAVYEKSASRVRAIAYWRVDCGRQSRGLWLVCEPKSGCIVEDAEAAIDILRAASGKPMLEPTDAFGSTVSSARRVCRRHVEAVIARLEAARIAGDALRPGLPQCRIASWLSQSLQSTIHHAVPEIRSATDRVLERLARRFTVAGERELSRIADHLPAHPNADFLNHLEQQVLLLVPDEPGPAVTREIGLLLLIPDA